MIDFLKLKVNINGYSIQSGNYISGWSHMKNWVIEVSENGVTWVEIDRRENNDDLNGFKFQHYFSVSDYQSSAYRYLRIKCVGPTHHNESRYDFSLAKFEVYGQLIEE